MFHEQGVLYRRQGLHSEGPRRCWIEHKVCSVVDKVSYLNGQKKKRMKHLMPERCVTIKDVGTLTEAIESTSVDVACRS